MIHARALRLRARTPARAGVRGARAFSLIEVVLVAALAAGLFLLSIQYVVSLVGSSQAGVEATGAQRDVQVLRETIRGDLLKAHQCDAYGFDAPLLRVGDNTIEFNADVNGDGISDQVGYQVTTIGNTLVLQRAVVLGPFKDSSGAAVPCPTGGVPPASWQTIADNLVADSATPPVPVFTPLKAGASCTAPIPPGGQSSSCTIPNDHSTPASCEYGNRAKYCLFDAIRIHLLLRSTGKQAITTSLDDTVPVNLQGSRL